MGTFSANFTIRNRNGGQSLRLRGVVDTGASYTVIPAHILDQIGVIRDYQEFFSLADSSVQELFVGLAEMELAGKTRPVEVVFGSSSTKILIGAMALESFALAADAKNHRLIPAELTL